MPRKARNRELRHSGWAELGMGGDRLTSMETPAVMPPLSAMSFRALVNAAADASSATSERGIRRPPRLTSVTFCQGFSV